jgi:non-ribosomal peptide synthetase component F
VTGSRDIPVGVSVAGRADLVLEELAGFFVNTLVLRTNLAGDPDVAELLDRVRAGSLTAFANQDVPFDRLVEAVAPERTAGRHPLFQVMLTVDNHSRAAAEFAGLVSEPLTGELGVAKFDLRFDITERFGSDGAPAGVDCFAEYATDVFDRATVERLTTWFVRVLAAMAADLTTPVRDIEVLDAADRERMVVAWNDTGDQEPGPGLPALVERAAAARPEAVAIADGATALTYRELDTRANRLAHWLVARGVGPERFVAVVLPRSADAVVAMLAVLKAGGAYVPVDPAYPGERIDLVLADCAATLALTGPVDTTGFPSTRPDITIDRRSAAYMIYTSGSTGRPKGVVVEHGSVGAYVSRAARVYDGAADVAQVPSSLAFDLTVTGLWATLAAGGTVRLAGLGDDPAADAPAFMKLTPSQLPLLTDEGRRGPSSWVARRCTAPRSRRGVPGIPTSSW